jgi:hypothetical protein
MKLISLALLALVVATQDPDPHAWLTNEPQFWYGALMRAVPALQDGPPECTADKPWMCGVTEIGCSRTGHQPAGDDAKEFYACSCKHTCNKEGSRDDETQSRNWDRACKTRCSPSHCHCEHPCGAT